MGPEKQERKPWNWAIIPTVNWPFMVSQAPAMVMALLHTTETTEGISPSSCSIRTERICCVLTLAWKPAQRPKKPFSAPLDLMVSIISTPETVALASFAAERICTRLRLIRFWEMKRAMTMFTAMEISPSKVSCQL